MAFDMNRINSETEDQKMIFPLNVHESLAASSGFKKGEKTGLALSFWAFGNGLLAWFLASFLRTIFPRYYGWITLGVILVIQLTVGVYLLRYLFDERAMFAEIEGQDASFANYFRIYKDSVLTLNDKCGVIEYDDGTYGVFLQCRMGYNTEQKSSYTWELNREIFKAILRAGLCYNVIYASEQFRGSKACKSLLDQLKTINDPRLFTAQRDILQNLLDIATEESNVPCMTIVIYARTQIDKDNLPPLITKLETMLSTGDTCYREARFLTNDEIIEFLRHYYQLEILDMGMLRAHTAIKRDADRDAVKVLKVYGKSGKVYTTEQFDRIADNLIASAGLKRGN